MSLNNSKNIYPVILLACSLSTGTTLAAQKPNVLWLVSEDNSASWIGCYGNKISKTPNIDRLATRGFQYMNAFASAPVCAPSRSTWITGINALSMGTQNMRSRYKIPENILYYPDALRAAGYFTANFTKKDYNISSKRNFSCWDEDKVLDWDKLKKNQPFFQVINTAKSHESQAKLHLDKLRQDPAEVQLFAYHPDIPTIRKNYARYYDCIENMDKVIGEKLQELEDAGLSDNTIVIYNSDHGGVLPRGKRFLFENGLRSPLVIYIPEKFKSLWPAKKPGTKIDRLVSFLDMPKTWISLLGGTPPKTMQGRIFLGTNTEPEQGYHFAFRGRMDERVDNQRAICNKKFLYIRNYMPYVPWGQKLEYMWEIPMTKAWDDYNKAGKTTAVTGRFFTPKNSDELYDMEKDPDSVNNLINNPEYRTVVKKMRKQLTEWQERIYDAGMLPESEIAKRAKKNNTTIYEMARNPKLYNLKAYLKLSDLALEKNPNNLPTFEKSLQSPDLGIRYWGVVGCFLLSDDLSSSQKKALANLLSDPSHEVRGMAAWVVVKTNDQKKEALDALEKMIQENSYAILSILNILDWMGDDARSLMPAVGSIQSKDQNIQKMQRTLFEKFGIDIPASAKKQLRQQRKK
jgi:arylsulfatase A-like enzyme